MSGDGVVDGSVVQSGDDPKNQFSIHKRVCVGRRKGEMNCVILADKGDEMLSITIT